MDGKKVSTEGIDAKKVSRGGKLKRIIRRSYVLGFLSCVLLIAVVLMVMKLFGLGKVVVGADYDEYTGILKRYGKYYELVEIINKNAIAEYSPEKIDDNVIRDVIKELDDPYAQYFTEEEYEEYMSNYESSYTGIGVAVTAKDQSVVVYSVMVDQPAEKAGIKAGDIIVEVDGKKITNLDEATDALLGEPGTEVNVTVSRDGKHKNFTISRAKIEVKSVAYKKYDKKNKVGYIYISAFKKDTAKEFKLAVKDLKNDGYNKIIIDVRNNGGGLTAESLDIADFLLPEGVICSEKDKYGRESVEKSDASSAGIDFVMLINGHTASASELLAGAVQDNDAGKLIGSTTYGKGVTQKTFRLSDRSVVKLTITEYFTPDGHKVDGKGIKPDIEADENEDILKIAHDTLLQQ